jgi:hypothetical protein
MAIKGIALSGVCYIAWNSTLNVGQAGDAANHSLHLVRDGIEGGITNSPSEIDSLGCPGLYSVNLTAAEMNANLVVLSGKSSTLGVSIVPVEIITNAS